MANQELSGSCGHLGAVLSARAVEKQTDAQLLEQFTALRDECAFAALVERHGPMVLAVCQRVLNDVHHAEDAFQVTFLVLARKAWSLARPELLGNWLYGVAYRTAVKAKVSAARRRASERQVLAMPSAEPPPELAWRDLRGVLDEEMSRLPEKYRAPMVLCYLEGKTNEEAARELGWPAGSMSGRLARGRQLIRRRLTQRGLALSAAMLFLLLSQKAAPAAVPAMLARAAVRAALQSAGGGSDIDGDGGSEEDAGVDEPGDLDGGTDSHPAVESTQDKGPWPWQPAIVLLVLAFGSAIAAIQAWRACRLGYLVAVLVALAAMGLGGAILTYGALAGEASSGQATIQGIFTGSCGCGGAVPAEP